MGRVKIKFPAENPLYRCSIPVRISDINYGNHLGNDALLSIIHEARMQLLRQWGYTELDVGGNSLIMGDVMIAYRGEAFYGDILTVDLFAEDISERSFALLYRIATKREGKPVAVADARTGMVCFDYTSRTISTMTAELKTRLQALKI